MEYVYGIRVKIVRDIGICLEKLRDYGINVSYGIGISIKKVRDYGIRVSYSTPQRRNHSLNLSSMSNNGGRVTLKIIFQLACRVKGGA